MKLYDYCVYTIATPQRLKEASDFGTDLHESKRWVTASSLFDDARKSSKNLPIVFADARNCSKLIAWSVLSSVRVTDSGTTYSVGRLWQLPVGTTQQDLQLMDSEEFIAKGHIRPYVLCQTPKFLVRKAKAPKLWRPSVQDSKSAKEGELRLVEHQRRERSARLVAATKKDWMERNDGRLPCQICGFDFLSAYGPIGAGFAEVHHIELLSEAPTTGQNTTIDDLAVVCPNCHRMLHMSPEFPSMESLRGRMRNAQKKHRK